MDPAPAASEEAVLEEGELPASHGDILAKCEVCRAVVCKYRCPACSIRTCSLLCCQSHKEKTGCSGKRDRTAFCSLRDFTERQLKDDYLFLEDVMATRETAASLLKKRLGGPGGVKPLWNQNRKRKRAIEKSEGGGNPFNLSDGWIESLPPVQKRLVYKAKERQVDLFLMPSGMSKRKRNSSKFENGKIFWRVEFEFRGADAVRRTEEKFDETKSLKEVMENILRPKPGNAPLRQRLKDFTLLPAESLVYLLERLPAPANGKTYYRLDPMESLRHNLAGKVLVEFPVVTVLTPKVMEEEKHPLFIQDVGEADGQGNVGTQALLVSS